MPHAPATTFGADTQQRRARFRQPAGRKPLPDHALIALSNLWIQPLNDYGTNCAGIFDFYPVDMWPPQFLLSNNPGSLGVGAKVTERVSKLTHTNFARPCQQVMQYFH